MATPSATIPISFTRLKQIANDACQSALGSAKFYEHGKTETWNTTIINSMLKSIISESSPPGGTPQYKYAINSTIIQHLVPTSALNKPRSVPSEIESTEQNDVKTEATGTYGKPHVGRRGMHSATGAFWNEKTDGMWSYKYEGGESKGLDVVISVIWVAL